MEQIPDGRRTDPPAIELDRLSARAFDLVRDRRLTTRAGRVLAAAAAYTAHASGVLGWAGTLGEDRTVSEGVRHLGLYASTGLAEVSTLGWNQAEARARQAARHMIAAVRAALAGIPEEFAQQLGETAELFDRLEDALARMPSTTPLPALDPEAVSR